MYLLNYSLRKIQDSKTFLKKKRVLLKKLLLGIHKFHIKRYLCDINPKSAIFTIGISILIFLFYELFIEFSTKNIVRPVLSKFRRDSYWADFLVILFFVLCCLFAVRRIKRGIIPTLNSIIFFVLSLVLYRYIIISDRFDFFYFKSELLDNCYYATPIILGFLLLFGKYKSIFKALEVKRSKISLVEDDSNPKNVQDSFESVNFAKSISEFISGTTTNLSFGIAIFGEWGTGKTYLLKRIEQELSSKPHENITIEFNPWRLKDSEGIIEAFFDSLVDVLAPYSKSISKKINDYSDKILGNSEDTIGRVLNEMVNFIIPRETLEKKFESINHTIKSTGKRIVIFIDDLDRLTSNEILDVLRLIRNTANFSNTFFVVALDREYLINSLKNQKIIHNESQYLDKVFQLSLYLPILNKNSFLPLFEETLFTDDFTIEEKHEIKKTLNLILTPSVSIGEKSIDDGTFLSFIDTPRDLKRFCNSFKVSFKLTNGYVEIADLFVLELIKVRFPFIYEKIRDKSFLNDLPFSNEYDLEFFEQKWDEFVGKNGNIKMVTGLCYSLKFLFFIKTDKNPNRFSIPSNYMNYFSYHRFTTININDFHRALDLDEDTMFLTFENWLNDGKDLDSIIYEINSFPNREALLKYVTTLLRLNQDRMFERAIDLSLRNRWEIFEKYFGKDEDAYTNFLNTIIENTKIDLYTRARFFSSIDGIHLEYSESDKIRKSIFVNYTSIEIATKILNLFKEYLISKDNSGNIHEALEFYYLNEERSEESSGKVIISQGANTAFREYLENTQTPFESFTKILIRPYYIPYRGELTMEPFLEQIFGNWERFKDKLEQTEFDNADMQRLKRIILEYIEENYCSTKRYFIIKDYFDRQFVENYLNLIRV